MELKLEIGRKIKSARIKQNIRMCDAARKVGITRATLWAIEKGIGNYSIDALIKILDLLDMDISIGSKNEDLIRKRATRINTVLDKKKNKFIVMCVEQYAASNSLSSQIIYKKLKEIGVIDELKDDYEDMHGYSITSLIEYIDKRLVGGKL